MPRKELSLDNLPMPLFVRGDDMEYGKRLTKKLLTLNGIGVWHVPVHNKYSSFMNYYVTRNTLILNSLYDENFGKFAFIKIFAIIFMAFTPKTINFFLLIVVICPF